MKILVFLALCFILPALTVACTLGLHKYQPAKGIAQRS